MLQQLEKIQQSWCSNDRAIDKWLSDRKTVLVEYCKLAGLKPYRQEDQLPSATEVRAFCDILLDYTSAGHFEMYDKLITSDGRTCQLASQIYPQINATTDVVLNFNDQYSECTDDSALESLDHSLCSLGEALSQRFELEDRLIANLAEKRALSA